MGRPSTIECSLACPRAATAASVVSLLDTPALTVPVVVGIIADRAGLTAVLTISVTLAAALVALIPRLPTGGSHGERTTAIEQCAD